MGLHDLEEAAMNSDADSLVVSIPTEILIQMVEAQPSFYPPEMVDKSLRLRAKIKQTRAIPQFDELDAEDSTSTVPVSLLPELSEAITAAAGRTLAEQIRYEVEVNHGWRFPYPGDTAREEQIRESYTLREWVNLYLRFHVRFAKSGRNNAHLMLTYFGPLLSVTPSKLSRTAVMQWAQAIGRQHPMVALHAIGRLRNLYNKATEWNLYAGPNPAAYHRLFPKQSRSRFLQPEEVARILRVLPQLSPIHSTYFLTLLFTGARRSEAAQMQWEHLDLANGLWHKPTTKTGHPHTVPLPEALQERLHQLPRTGRYVFPAERTNNHANPDGPLSATAIQYQWNKIRQLTGAQDVRIHDIRRTCASWLAINGENLAVIQKVLNHSSLAVTEVYARLNLAPVRAALEGNAQRMLLLGPQGVPSPTPTPPPVPVAEPTPRPDPKPGPSNDSRTEMEWPG